MDIPPSIEDICEVERLTLYKPSLLQPVGEGESDEGDELVRRPGGVVGELLLLQSQVAAPSTQ